MEQDKVKKIAENMEDDYIFKAIEEYSIDKDDIIVTDSWIIFRCIILINNFFLI
jgi:hypothetical protein